MNTGTGCRPKEIREEIYSIFCIFTDEIRIQLTLPINLYQKIEKNKHTAVCILRFESGIQKQNPETHNLTHLSYR
jgi:hypothetical protein